MGKLIIASVLMALQFTPVLAAPVTLSCDIISSSDDANLFNDVNQIILDVAASTVDLRIAQTIGTDKPMNWIFHSRTDSLGVDTFTIKRSGAFLYGAGLYGAAAHSFALGDDGALSWAFFWEGKLTTFKWRCSK